MCKAPKAPKVEAPASAPPPIPEVVQESPETATEQKKKQTQNNRDSLIFSRGLSGLSGASGLKI